MKLPKYPLASSDNLTTFEFVSVGPKGRISKLVQYSQTNLKDVFNLAFGDQASGNIDDSTISNNGDSETVLATIVSTVYAFTSEYPEASIYATGSTKARTRLYRMGISKYYLEAKADFDIYGQLDNKWESFKKGVDYEGFLVKRKK
jgi:hypothetical protein